MNTLNQQSFLETVLTRKAARSGAYFLFGSAKNILKEEGLAPLIKKVVFLFLSSIFNRQTFYIYESKLDGVEFTPKIKEFTLKIISTPEQIDALASEGLDFNLAPDNVKSLKGMLGEGGVLFCFFVNKELAHTDWIAMNERVNLDPFPLKVDWQNEACIGPTDTKPKYRGLGITPYVYCKMFQFLKEKGRSRAKFTTAKSNIAAQKAQAKIGTEIIAEGTLYKFLLWKFYKQKPTRKVNR